jgi:pimeloyl-ACP methyl ester carboxylesterase
VPTVHANGLDIGYDLRGAGPPMVLLHGATSSGREDFAAQVPSFSRAFLVHLPDARGHATTRWDAAGGFHADWLVDDLQAFVDALGLASFHLVGFSMGAMTALQFAVRHPERLRTLVVIGITTQREPRASVARRLMDPDRVDRLDPAWAAELSRRHDAVQGEGAWRRLLPAIAADVAAQPLLTPRDLRRVELPALVVAGDRDPFTPVDHAWGLQRQLPDGRLLIVPDCGHEVMVRRPGLFSEALAGFYRSTESTSRRRVAAHGGTRADRASLTHPASPADIEETDLEWLDESGRARRPSAPAEPTPLPDPPPPRE